jgi:hypothetical protein
VSSGLPPLVDAAMVGNSGLMTWVGCAACNRSRSPSATDDAATVSSRLRRGRVVFAGVLLFVACLTAVAGHAPLAAFAQRGELSEAELMSDNIGEVAIVDNAWFLPAGEERPALHSLEGTLEVPRFEMQRSNYGFPLYKHFPGFTVDFFTVDDYLVPAERSIIVNPGNWSLILSPGRVWSEPGDGGRSRASFPFTLGSPPDRLFTGGEAHNGVATFLFDEESVSSLRFQITQETAPDGDIFDMWGQAPMEYEPRAVEGVAELAAAFAVEIAAEMPIHPWSDLEEQYGGDVLDAFTAGLAPEEISAAGIVVDGAVYLQPSTTRHGEYPFPRQMQHAGMSISKSIGAGIAMLWLAEEYGEAVFDLRIGDYLEVTASHDGWSEVTFGDVLDMATGVGDNAPDRLPYDVYANETGPNSVDFYLAETTEAKLDAAFAAANYAWGPGEVLRYTSAQTFVLAAAMDAYLEAREGPGTDLWERLTEEVFRPIGVHHMTMMRVADEDGNGTVPLMASGLRLTVDDVGKIATLLQNGGSHDGRQLLHEGRLRDALYRTGQLAGLPSGKSFEYGDQAYHASFWSLPYRTEEGAYFQVPFMSGAGGNTIFLAPNGVSTFVFTDSGRDTYSLNSPAVAEAIRPYPAEGLDGISLIANGFWSSTTLALIALALVVLGVGALLTWWALRRRARPRGGDL